MFNPWGADPSATPFGAQGQDMNLWGNQISGINPVPEGYNPGFDPAPDWFNYSGAPAPTPQAPAPQAPQEPVGPQVGGPIPLPNGIGGGDQGGFGEPSQTSPGVVDYRDADLAGLGASYGPLASFGLADIFGMMTGLPTGTAASLGQAFSGPFGVVGGSNNPPVQTPAFNDLMNMMRDAETREAARQQATGPGGYGTAGAAAPATPDPGVMGVPGGLAGRGQVGGSQAAGGGGRGGPGAGSPSGGGGGPGTSGGPGTAGSDTGGSVGGSGGPSGGRGGSSSSGRGRGSEGERGGSRGSGGEGGGRGGSGGRGGGGGGGHGGPGGPGGGGQGDSR